MFDPEGLKAVDYKSTYPELASISEFEDLGGRELIFVWYYANATSPLLRLEENKRVEEAMKLSGIKLSPEYIERYLKLQFGETLERAIAKMSSFLPGARYLGWQAIKAIFDQYIDIAHAGTSSFTKSVGSGEEKEDVIDYSAYTTTTSKISASLPNLIARLEEGFGISTSLTSGEDEDESTSIFREWVLNKQKN